MGAEGDDGRFDDRSEGETEEHGRDGAEEGFMAGWDGDLAEARAEGEEKGAAAGADRGGRARGAADLRR